MQKPPCHCPGARIESVTGVSQRSIRETARFYGQAKHAVFAWGMGLTHHLDGVGNVEQVANLALLRGMVGRVRAGLLPLRGHSNVLGIGSIVVKPVLAAEVIDAIESRGGGPPASRPWCFGRRRK